MNLGPTNVEQEVLRKVGDEYKGQGYEVVVAPKLSQLPKFLRPFRPDMVARRNDETVVGECALITGGQWNQCGTA